VELRHIRYFLAVAEELNFTRAAARLRIAQPGLSQQIRRLERELGVDLFHRSHHAVQLTEAGRVFAQHARQVLDETDRATRAAQDTARGLLSRLSIGFHPDGTREMLTELLVSYRTRHPRVDTVLHELRSAEQVDALIDGRIHVGLAMGRHEEPRLRFVPVRHRRLVVAMPANHRLAGRRSLRLRELAGERWIHPFGGSSALLTACAAAGFEPLIAMCATGPDSRLAFVASGVGLALVGEWVMDRPARHVVFRPLDGPEATVDLVAAWRVDRPSPVVDGFLDVARSMIRPCGA